MRKALVRQRFVLWMTALTVSLAAAVVYAGCCYEITWPKCDELFGHHDPTCEEQCGDSTYFGGCGSKEGSDVYEIPVPDTAERGFYSWAYYGLPVMCSDIYYCVNTETRCAGPGLPRYKCATGDWKTFSITAGAYGIDPGCPDE